MNPTMCQTCLFPSSWLGPWLPTLLKFKSWSAYSIIISYIDVKEWKLEEVEKMKQEYLSGAGSKKNVVVLD